MLHRRILYAALLLAAILFQIFFRFYLSTFTLILVVLLPGLSLLLTLPQIAGKPLRLLSGPNVLRGESGQFTLRLEQRGPLPMTPIQLSICWSNQLTGEGGRLSQQLYPCGRETTLSIPTPAAHCGRLVCTVERASAYDLLGLFDLPVQDRPSAALLSLPLRQSCQLPEALDSPASGGTLLRPRPGGGPGEDYDLREYRPGDPLRSIHWKLSSKLDQPVVRETLEPKQAEIILTYDHFGPPEELDQMFDRLTALSRLLLSAGRIHHIQWAAPVSGQVEDRLISSEGALLAFLDDAFSIPAPAAGRSILDQALKVPDTVGPPLHFHLTPRDLKGGQT